MEKKKKVEFCFYSNWGDHVFFQTTSGDFFGCGQNNTHQINKTLEKYYHTPQKLDFFPKRTKMEIKSASTGFCHSLFLTVANGAYSCGDNASNQLSQNNPLGRIISPDRVVFDSVKIPRIIEVVAGRYRSHYLTSTGEVFSGGKNNSGQLGIGREVNPLKHLAKKIPGLCHVTKIITANQVTVFAVKKCLELWVCGKGPFGESATNDRMTEYHVPRKITWFNEQNIKISDIFVVKHTTFFRTAKNEIYGSGYNYWGEFCNDHTRDSGSLPVLALGICGSEVLWNGVPDHFVVFKKNGKLYGSGYCKDAIGNPDINGRNGTPGLIPFAHSKNVVQIVASWETAYYFLRNGEVYTAGNNTRGQCMLGHSGKVEKLTRTIGRFKLKLKSPQNQYSNERMERFNFLCERLNGRLTGSRKSL